MLIIKKLSFPNALKTRAKVQKNSLKALSLPKISLQQQQGIVDLVDEITRKKALNHNSNTLALEKQIDEMVYRIYDLIEDEIAVIER